VGEEKALKIVGQWEQEFVCPIKTHFKTTRGSRRIALEDLGEREGKRLWGGEKWGQSAWKIVG